MSVNVPPRSIQNCHLPCVMRASPRVVGASGQRAAARRKSRSPRCTAASATSEPARLCGGRQQRVAIARALAMDPKIMLFDEVTSALDPRLVGEVPTATQQLARGGMRMIAVTHEMSFARDVADRIVFMDGGVIVEEGKPDQLSNAPRTGRVRQFLKRCNDRCRL